MMLMMHCSASIASLASPDPIFIAFLTLALERSPPPTSGFALSNGEIFKIAWEPHDPDGPATVQRMSKFHSSTAYALLKSLDELASA